jgi:hypothetical protein
MKGRSVFRHLKRIGRQSDTGPFAVAALALITGACSDRNEATTAIANSATPSVRAQEVHEGQLVSYVADFEDGHSEHYYSLKVGEAPGVRLVFDSPPNLTAGSRLRVSGDTTGESLHVADYKVLSAAQTVDSAPPEYAALPAQDTYALVLVDLGSGVNVDTATGTKLMFSTTPSDKSFASFYYESSYGKYSITGDVVGPYMYSMTTCNSDAMDMALQAQIPKKYNHYIYYFSKTSLCAWQGLGQEGSANRPAAATWMNGSLNCVVLMQEPGHNIGLMHANTMACGSASFSTTPSTSCTITEYGDGLTPMGGGCHQLNGYEKWYEQWLTGCNGLHVTSSGTFNLVPLGLNCPGAVQVLQIPLPSTLNVTDPQSTSRQASLKDYYVELRAAAGSFDQYDPAGFGRFFGTGISFSGPIVSVYVSDDAKVAAPTGPFGGFSVGNSDWTYLLNMTPGSTTFTALTSAGQSFADPGGGPTITLQSISATGAVISVDIPNGSGGPTCLDGTTLTGSGSACDGGAVVIPPIDAGSADAQDSGGASDAGAQDAQTGNAQGTGVPDAASATSPSAHASAPASDAGLVPAANSAAPASGDAASWGDNAGGWEASPAPGCACESAPKSAEGAADAWLASLAACGILGLRKRAHKRTRRAPG